MFDFSPGVDHAVLKQVGEQFLNIRSGAGTTGAKAQYRGGEMNRHCNKFMLHQHWKFSYSFNTYSPRKCKHLQLIPDSSLSRPLLPLSR